MQRNIIIIFGGVIYHPNNYIEFKGDNNIFLLTKIIVNVLFEKIRRNSFVWDIEKYEH